MTFSNLQPLWEDAGASLRRVSRCSGDQPLSGAVDPMRTKDTMSSRKSCTTDPISGIAGAPKRRGFFRISLVLAGLADGGNASRDFGQP
jgi:hypothetical protein